MRTRGRCCRVVGGLLGVVTAIFLGGTSRLAKAVLVVFFFLLGVPEAHADSIDTFRSGLEAVDRSQWLVAAERFREAAAQDNQESEKRVFVSGVFSHPYLPHFYLGWSLYKAGLGNCDEALQELDISEQQGIVTGFKRQMKDLREAQDSCNGRLLPGAAAAAAQSIEKAAGLLGSLPQTLEDPKLANKKQEASQQLEAARAAFATGQASARVGDYRRAETEASNVEVLLQDLASQVKGSVATILDEDVERVAEAIARAEREENQLSSYLGDPDRSEALQTLPEIQIPLEARRLIRGAKEKLERRESAASLEEARRDAVAAERQLQEMASLARQRLASWDAVRAQEDTTDAALPVVPIDGEEELSPVPRLDREEEIPAPRESPQIRLQESVLEARDLLARLAATTGGELFSLQRSRLESLVAEAGQVEEQGVETWRGRLATSTSSLRLIAGVTEFLAARPERCIELLDGREFQDPRFAAEAYLFLAAARFAVFRQGGEEDSLLREQAAAAARRSHRSDPSRQLDQRTFSPLFRRFFASAVP